jgi:hypothetical protein
MASAATNQVFDTMFGTKYHTPGAELQLPRKVPMRVEPKSYFGELRRMECEAWCSYAVECKLACISRLLALNSLRLLLELPEQSKQHCVFSCLGCAVCLQRAACNTQCNNPLTPYPLSLRTLLLAI